MLTPTFPSYQSPDIASRWGCHNCCSPLNPDTLEDSGYPPGRGQYRMKCTNCTMSTWFDLAKELSTT